MTETPLRYTKINRNLEYQWRVFGLIELLDAIFAGSIALFVTLCCYIMGANLAWGLPVLLASLAASYILRWKTSHEGFILMLKFAFRRHRYEIFARDTESLPFPVAQKGTR